MPEKKLHNALCGYKKQEVHAYIAEISENAEKEALKYQEAAEEFKAELAAVKERQISQQNKHKQQLQRVEQQAAVARRELDSVKAQLEQKQEQLQALRGAVEAFEQEKKALLEKVEEAEKEKKVISSVLVQAQDQAGNIVGQAKKQAEEVLEQLSIEQEEQRRIAALDLDQAQQEIKKTTDEMLSLKEQLVSAMERYKNELDYLLTEYRV